MKTNAPDKARILRTNNTVEEVTPANGRSFTLEELQRIVGGYVEIHLMPDGRTFVVLNEDGLSLNLPFNTLATVAAYHLNVGPEGVRGDALLVPNHLLD